MKNIIKTKSSHSFLFCVACTIFCIASVSSYGQDTTKHGRKLKNTIKINLTAPILYDNATQLSYERLIGKNQSINIFAGYNEFPTSLSLNLSNTKLSNTSKKSGNMFGVDYRFYLQKENKYAAPHGVYLAPFISYYGFTSTRTLTYTDSTGSSSSNLKTKINFFNIGGELGYQFVLGKRWVIDAVVFGPAITNYDFKLSLEGNIPGLDENETFKQIIDALKDKLPLLNDLSKDKEVNGSGHEAFWSVGFRYNISVGFRF